MRLAFGMESGPGRDKRRPVDDGRRLLVDAVFANVLDDADHLLPGLKRSLADLLADRGRRRTPQFAGEVGGDERNRLETVFFSPCQIPARNQARAVGAEEVRRDMYLYQRSGGSSPGREVLSAAKIESHMGSKPSIAIASAKPAEVTPGMAFNFVDDRILGAVYALGFRRSAEVEDRDAQDLANGADR